MKPVTPSPGARLSDRDAAVRRALTEAIVLHGAGRYDDAMHVLEADGGRALKSAGGRNIAGDILLKQGKMREAVKSFDAAIRLAPTAAEPHANRGVALQAMGQLAEALAAEDRALKLRPEYATAHFNRGNILKALARPQDALAAFDRAVRAQPALAEAHFNRGMVLVELHRPLEALDAFNRALALRKTYVDAHVGRAGAYRDLHASEDALAALDVALAIEPAHVEARQLRAAIYIDLMRNAAALADADLLIAAVPNDVISHVTRARALYKLQRYDDALAEADVAVRLDPHAAEAYVVRGVVLAEVGRIAESLAALDAARRLGADDGEYFSAKALALSVFGDPQEAGQAFDQAVLLDPDNVTLHSNRGFFLLFNGAWREGWAEHEWRLKAPTHLGQAFGKSAPQWRGEDLTGKRLLVYAEQGFGDTLQFVRFVRLLEKSGAAFIRMSVQEPVRRLLADNFPTIDVSDTAGVSVDVDYQCSLMSLPHAFGTTLETLPAETPYLAADPARIDKWKARLGAEGFKIGIAWQGNPNYSRDRFRSIPLRQFAPLGEIPGVRLVSLAAGKSAAQLASIPAEMKVETLGEEVVANPDGFREIAAVMANLDLLVMSDTGPTHLAGALGRPVWLALSENCDWRWMRGREDTPWYPTMRLFRQQTGGDWEGVFRRIAGDVAARVAANG